MYEGVPNHPGNDRFWAIIEKYGVTIFYTAPTAIRTFMKWGADEPAKHDLSSLRVIGTVGRADQPRGLDVVPHSTSAASAARSSTRGGRPRPGAIMISPLPGATTTKPGSATFPLPGISAEVVDDKGQQVTHGGGYLTLTRPWPSMLRGIWGDPERYHETYWSPVPRPLLRRRRRQARRGRLLLAARARRRRDERVGPPHLDDRGRVGARLPSRVSPRRRSSAPTDATTGQAIIAYVIARGGCGGRRSTSCATTSATEIGALAKPKTIYLTPDLPKTRSGKIMRRLLRDVAEGRNLGDTTTLADASVVEEIQRRARSPRRGVKSRSVCRDRLTTHGSDGQKAVLG